MLKLSNGTELDYVTAAKALEALDDTASPLHAMLSVYEISELHTLAEIDAKPDGIEKDLMQFCLAVDKVIFNNYAESFACDLAHMQRVHGFNHTTFTGDKAPKYAKVFAQGHHPRLFCFVEIATGDIYKPASYKAPAKHARGNIRDEAGNITARDVTAYGAKYLR